MRKLSIAIVVILAMMVLVGFPYYGYGDVIYGCYQKNNGQLRIVENTSECKKSEVPISWAGMAGPTTILVDCDNGETITDALQQLGDPLTIQVKGTCNENVEIVRNDVTLIAHPSGGTVNGGLTADKHTINVRASRIVIDGLTLTGGRTGVNGGAMIRNCTIQNTVWNGVSFYHGGNGTVDNCQIKNNPHHGIVIEGGSGTVINSTISSNAGLGIVINPGGSARIGITDRNQYAGNTISNNGSNGIHIAFSGSAFIGGNTISGNGADPDAYWGRYGIGVFFASADLVGYNRITGNKGTGVFAKNSTVLIGDGGFGLPIGAPGEDPNYANMITGNGTVSPNWGGVYGYLGTSLDIRYATISGNTGDGVILRLRSTARMYDDTINNNTGNGILLDQGGGLRLQGPEQNPPVTPVTAKGNGSGLALQCVFLEDSFLGAFAPGSQAVSGMCSGF
jgi:parallel beta-helix repeat protein